MFGQRHRLSGRSRSASWLAVAMASLCVGVSVTSAGTIQWRSGAVDIRALSPVEIASEVAALAAQRGGDARRVIVQLDGPLGAGLREELSADGLRLLEYLGENSFFAALDADADAVGLGQVSALVGIEAVRSEWKMHPLLASSDSTPWAQVGHDERGVVVVATYVMFHRDVDLVSDGMAAVERYGADVRGILESINGLVVEVSEDLIPLLAAEDAVLWIEPALPPMKPVNDCGRSRTGADTVQAPPYGLDGAGVTVLVYDGGTARATHVDFQGRASVHDSSGMHYHSTHVAGTIGGAGVANATYKGMAPGVTIVSYGLEQEGGLHEGFLYTDPCDIEDDYSEAIQVHGADIANNSIGTNTAPNGYPCDWEGNYGVTANLIDTIVRGDGSNPLFHEPFRIVWANGNERGSGRCGTEYHTTAPPACAKNHITVGALNCPDDTMSSFSSWGPSDDDRMKPDISAPGVDVTSCDSSSDTAYRSLSGTSMASPTVCGCLALLMEDYRNQFPGDPDPRNSTLKALLAHTATDIGNTGPDYMFGYGSIRIQPAIDVMRAEDFLEADVTSGGTYSVLALVEPGDSVLKVTMAWDDYPGTPNVGPNLVNDLDLRVYSPGGQRHYPWTLGGLANPGAPAVRTTEDHVNNIEQVLVNGPEVGAWRIEVYGYNVPQGPQSFSLAASPQLVACSSAGMVGLSAPLYACSAMAGIQVVDCDLNTDDETVETVTVTIVSDSEPGGETVLLTETGGATADFRGSIPLDDVNGAGVLLVANGDAVIATYIDADDGQGHYNVSVTAAATVDCQGPAIFNVQVASIGSETATITFETDESAVGTVRFGLACDALTESATEGGAGMAHTVEISDLYFNSQYFFAVDAVDNQGNPATDDNGGECYSFSTPNVSYSFPMDSDPGWSAAGGWAFGQPTGGGSGFGDPTSGHTGSNVYGYNLYGDYPNNLPAAYLTTTAIDCTGLEDVTLSFWRWLAVESNSNFDEATVEVSNNGANWTVIWRATDTGADVTDNSWQLQEFDISAIADNESNVYVRWGMGPTDGGVTMPGWNIDDVQFIATGGSLAIGFPDALPELMAPGEATEITVRIVEGDEAYVEDSGQLHYRYHGGVFLTAPLEHLGGEMYRATLPAATCDSTPEYYFSAAGTQSGTITQPPTAPSAVFSADVGVYTVVMEDNFNTNMGWTVYNGGGLTDGQWQRAIPTGGGVRCDPPTDYDGSGYCYVTDNGADNSDVDGGYTWLTSPTIDLSGGDAEVSYALWYANFCGDAPHTDYFVVEVSNNNGGNWTEVESFGPESAAGWTVYSFVVGDYVTPTAQVKVRFEASDFDPQSVVEAGIDAFLVSMFGCEDAFVLGDMDCDGDVDFDDIDAFVLALGGETGYLEQYPDCNWLNADCDGDGGVDFDDIDAFVALIGG